MFSIYQTIFLSHLLLASFIYGSSLIPESTQILRSPMQDLEGDIREDGLHVRSTSKSEGLGEFHIQPKKIGRLGNLSSLSLGTIETFNNGNIALDRGNLVEQYSASSEGIRQDFIIPERPDGIGSLFLSASFQGVSVEQPNEKELTLQLPSGRRLLYSKFLVYDANQKELPLHITYFKSQVFFTVDDRDAEYPVTIDPTVVDEDWVVMNPETPGTYGSESVYAADKNGNFYVGGSIEYAGGIKVRNIARWDGSKWNALGSGLNGNVTGMALDAVGNLVVIGNFDSAGVIAVDSIAKWDGSKWNSMGTLSKKPGAITIDQKGVVYVTQRPKSGTDQILKWEDGKWSSLSSISGSFYANCLFVDKSGNLYMAGSSPFIGDTWGGIAKWDGSNWNHLGSGVRGYINSLAQDSAGNIIAIGTMDSAGDIAVNHVAMWNGSKWSSIGDGFNESTWGVCVNPQGEIIVSGEFNKSGADSVVGIAKWNGTKWVQFGIPDKRMMSSLISFLHMAKNGDFYAGSLTGLVRKIGDEWRYLGNGIDEVITDIVWNKKGEMYVSGVFQQIGSERYPGIAKWTGSKWEHLGTGINGGILDMVFDNDDNLIVAGEFNKAKGSVADYIAMWNGTSWVPFDNGPNKVVSSLLWDPKGVLYVGGWFDKLGLTTTGYIAKWDGASWTGVGKGFDSGVSVLSMDSLGQLYAGGYFAESDGKSMRNVARWDGTVWNKMSIGLQLQPRSMIHTKDGKFYVGGENSYSGASRPIQYLAQWNGTSWVTVGGSPNGKVMAMSLDSEGKLLVAGQFDTVGTVYSPNMAQWDGQKWNALSGAPRLVQMLELGPDGSIYASGGFWEAGGVISPFFAKLVKNYHVPIISKQKTHSQKLHLEIRNGELKYQNANGKIAVFNTQGKRVFVTRVYGDGSIVLPMSPSGLWAKEER